MDQALNSQKTPHTSPLRASYGMSFVSILMKNDGVIKGFYCVRKLSLAEYWIKKTQYAASRIKGDPLLEVCQIDR